MNPDYLKEILESYSWIKVGQHTYYEDNGIEANYDDLKEHHKKETEFLINKCRELASELLKEYEREA